MKTAWQRSKRSPAQRSTAGWSTATATRRSPPQRLSAACGQRPRPRGRVLCTPWLTCLPLLLSFIAMSPQSLLSTWTQACPLCPGSHDHGDNTRGDQHVLGACLSPLRGGQPRKENSLSSDAPFDRGQKNRISGLSHITGALSTRQ